MTQEKQETLVKDGDGEKKKESGILLLYLVCMVEEQVQYADFILP